MNKFKKEERYVVIKRKHMSEAFKKYLSVELMVNKIPTVECVVVESDWSIYEKVWELVEEEFNRGNG